MKKLITITFALLLSAGNLMAETKLDNAWRYLEATDMIILDAGHGFKDLARVDLGLNRTIEDSHHSITIDLERADGTVRSLTLVQVREPELTGCGDRYFFGLPSKYENIDKMARFNLTLVDYTGPMTCTTLIAPSYFWKATIREGYGWCGTMDSTMTLAGDPKSVAQRIYQ